MPKDTKTPQVSAAKPSVPTEAASAYAAVAAQVKALSPDDLAPINVDIPRAVSIAVGAVPHLAKMRDVAAKLPGFDIAHIDRIGTYALAAWHAHLLALPEVASRQLAALLDEARPIREHLLLAAELLAHKGYFDKRSVEAIRAGQGNLDTANDVVALSALFTAAWPTIENRTTVTWEEVERAAQLGPQILIALGERTMPAGPEAGAMNANDRRQRAYTLFARAYDECRRAAVYLRWHEGDADQLVPSLYSGRNAPRRSPASPEAPEPAAAATPAPPAQGPEAAAP